MSRLLLALTALFAATHCGPPPPPPPPDPPRVTLTPVAHNVADVGLPISIGVSGCDKISRLELLDHEEVVFGPTWSGNPTEVVVPRESFATSYARGIAADLSLTVRVACADGRESESTPASVRFLPVAEVVKPAVAGGQVVTDVFVAEGQGSAASFVGCSGNPNGTTSWVRVDAAGAVQAFNSALPFACSIRTWVTDRHPVSQKRWAVEPGVGAFAFDAGLNITAFTLAEVLYLGVGPDGDAVIYDGASGSGTLQRISHENGAVKWVAAPQGMVIGHPVVHPTLGVYVPEYRDRIGQYQGTVAVERLAWADGSASGLADLRTITYGLGDAPPIPPVTLNADGSVLYFPVQTQAGATTVLACGTSANGCAGPDLKWQSPSLTGDVAITVAYHQNAILAAVAPRFAWFLDTATGSVLNRDGLPVSPEGALITMGVQPGRGQDFYLLNGSGTPGSLPTEIVAVDAPSSGELFRHAVPGTSVMAGVDDGGGLWLRIGPDLVRPLPLQEYALVRHR